MPVDAERVHDDSVNSAREKERAHMQSPGWQVEVDRATPAEWSQMLDLFDDANIYQTVAYGKVRWGGKNLSHLVLKQDGDVLAIAQLRVFRPTPLKFGIAYLRWGPLCERRGKRTDPEVHAKMARALEEEYVGKRRLLLRILPSAFAGSPRAEALESAFNTFDREPRTPGNAQRTLVLDLAPTLELLRRNLDKKWRNQLTRSEKNNLEITGGNGSEQYRRFCLIYDQMRKRKSFDSTLDVAEFGRIQENLTECHRMQVLICEEKGVPVAGLVASAMGDSAIYLLGATGDAGLNSKGAYLLQWSLVKWLKENGVRWYDLGGINPEGNPGVHHFKEGLSGMDVCRTNPFVASGSAISTATFKAGLAMQHAFRGSLGTLNFVHFLKRLATRN
jgi:lipid II:glycine glycyltransferase (peptidoglycan interpeptide bridge formation enzyme)